MANIKKSFNFRNGVQVDDDNLKVSATGLVGIGTTVPTESLDVRGNLVISGVTSSPTVQAGVLTVTTLNPTEIIGAGISIKSGIVTASSGIITFYGDGINLLNLPTSQWEDTIVGTGVSSIYNTGGNVGIATTAALFTLQVGNDANSGQKGVGISSFGDIKASGIVTATGFVGDLTGDVTGNLTGVAASTTQLETARTIGGVSFDGTSNIDLAGVNIAGNQDTSGTAANLSGTPNILINNLNAAGISTFNDTVIIGVGATVGIGTTVTFADDVKLAFGNDQDLEIYHSINLEGFTDSYIDSSARNLYVRLNTKTDNGGNIALQAKKDEHGILIHDDGAVDLFFDGEKRLETTQNGVTVSPQLDATNIVASGVITATTELNSPLIGVGTDAPANDIHVRKSGNAEIQVTSDTGIAGLTLGRESGTSNTNNAEFRYGGGAGASYSSNQSLDIINYGTGNFNYHLSAANAGNVDGDFHWHKGVNTSRLMTLTGIGGSLGIGITTPDSTLHVLGQAKISGNVILGGDLDVTGNAALNVVGRVTGDLVGNVFANSGVSTFKRLDLDTSSYYEFGELSASGVGIGTTMGNFKFVCNDDADKKFFITDSGNVGIATTSNNGNALFVNGAVVALDPIGIGTDEPRAAVDFADAGQATTGLAANRMYMIPPKVGAGQTAGLVGLVAGAMIYNTTLNKLQVYNGTNWETITSA